MGYDVNSIYDLTRLAGHYNSGKLRIFGFCRFEMDAGTVNTYPTSRSALVMPLNGQAEFRFNEQVFCVSRGILLHGCPNRLLTIRALGDIPFEYVVMYYDGMAEMLFSCDLPRAEEIYPLLEQIVTISGGNQLKAQYEATALTEKFLDLIFSEVIPPSLFAEQQFLQKLTDYIHEHYGERITLQTLADYSGESKARISYLFYKHYQVRPIDYLISYRMEQAVQMLRDGLPVGKTAKNVGYNDAFYFSRIFKRRLGVAPSALKRSD